MLKIDVKIEVYKIDKPWLAVFFLEDRETILNISHLPLKLPFSASYLFFGPPLIVYKPQALSSDIKATGRTLLTGYHWDT